MKKAFAKAMKTAAGKKKLKEKLLKISKKITGKTSKIIKKITNNISKYETKLSKSLMNAIKSD